jgi:hypothetical protein
MQTSWVLLAIAMFIVIQTCAVLTALKLRKSFLRRNPESKESEQTHDHR